MKNIKQLELNIAYRFKNKQLAKISLQHASYINEKFLKPEEANERLEFLGDAILGAVISEYIFQHFTTLDEGKLSIIKSSLVSRECLAELALKIDLGQFLKLGKGEEKNNARTRPSMLSCAIEALIGAVYLDSDFDTVKQMILMFYHDKLTHIDEETEENERGKLQQYTQTVFKTTPEYKVLKETGPSHDKSFTMAVLINGEMYGTAEETSKKKASIAAAKQALQRLNNEAMGKK